jgi:hypothetical protein
MALLTALAMAIPAAAHAQPYGRPYDRPYDRDDQRRTYDRDDQRRTYDRDRDAWWDRDRYDRRRWAGDYRGRWVPLARGVSARTERQFINVGGDGRYRRLWIEAVRGEPVILRIAIVFSDRTRQVIEYRDSLPAGTGEVIDLHGRDRRIHRIIIHTDPRSRGAYSVYGA